MTTEAQRFDTAHVRGMLAQRWRERSWRGVWFYGTWLFNRYYGTAILANIAVALAAIFIIRGV